MTRIITDEEWAEMYKLREPNLEQLEFFAGLCKCNHIVRNEKHVTIVDGGICRWDPVNNDKQTKWLLEVIIKGQDCKLFYDDGAHEYFIYQYTGLREQAPPVAHRNDLNEAVMEAAMNLWFPEE
jgi:hypothetical protein